MMINLLEMVVMRKAYLCPNPSKNPAMTSRSENIELRWGGWGGDR